MGIFGLTMILVLKKMPFPASLLALVECRDISGIRLSLEAFVILRQASEVMVG
jgi:hypothetical protein